MKHRGIHLGTNTDTARAVYLRPDRLFTHLHIVGPPGSGKTRAVLNLYEQLAHMDATVVLFNPKGALGTMARDWSIANGYTDRLIFFDPGDQTHVISYNPLRPNGASIATQAKGVRESLRAAWGQSDFSVTPQLARFLLWALWGARDLRLTMIEALDLLRPRSVVRARFLESGSDPYVRDALAYFDTLREARQDELAASSLARLEAFILDPILRRIFGQHARSLEMDRVLRERKLLIVNLEQYQPLRADDVRLLGRLLINDLVAHVFARPPQDRISPVFLLIDEVQTFLTDDLATALDQGRELGLGCVLAHQHMSQVIREDGTGHLADSVRNCARTKLVFGGLSVKEIDGHHVDDLCIDALNPRRIKDEITSLELHPVEETRTSVTRTTSRSGAASYARSRSKSYSDSRSRGRGETRGRSGATSRQRSLTTGWSNTSGRTEGKGSSYSEGSSSTHSVSEAPLLIGPDGTLIVADPLHGSTSGHSDSWSDSDYEATSYATAKSGASSDGRSSTRSYSTQSSEESSEGHTDGVSEETSESRGKQWSDSVSVQTSPWMSYRKRRNVSSRTFEPIEEQRLAWIQRIKAQPKGHFALRVFESPTIFVRAPRVATPEISDRLARNARARMVARPYVAHIEQVDREERERRDALLAPPAGRKPPRSSDDEPF